MAGLDRYTCMAPGCGKQTMMDTGQPPLEGLHYNDGALADACNTWVKANHPDVYAELANSIAGQPDSEPPTTYEGAPEYQRPHPPDDAPVPPAVAEIRVKEPEPETPSVSATEPAADEAVSDPAPPAPEPTGPSDDEIAAAQAVLDQAGVEHG